MPWLEGPTPETRPPYALSRSDISSAHASIIIDFHASKFFSAAGPTFVMSLCISQFHEAPTSPVQTPDKLFSGSQKPGGGGGG